MFTVTALPAGDPCPTCRSGGRPWEGRLPPRSMGFRHVQNSASYLSVIWKKLCVLVAQSCPTLCSPVDCSPPGSSVHGDSLGKKTGVGCHALLQGNFPTQESDWGLPPCRRILYQLSCREALDRGLFPKEPKCHNPAEFAGKRLHTGFSVVLAHTVWFAAFDLYRLKGLYFIAMLKHTV